MPFKRQKSNVSPHYHDTRTLLRKYRDVIWNLEVSDLDLQEGFKAEYGLSTDALFVDSEVNKGGNRLENYARALELGYVTNVPAGCGLIRCAGNIVPFTNSFPKDTKLYKLMSTNPSERKE